LFLFFVCLFNNCCILIYNWFSPKEKRFRILRFFCSGAPRAPRDPEPSVTVGPRQPMAQELSELGELRSHRLPWAHGKRWLRSSRSSESCWAIAYRGATVTDGSGAPRAPSSEANGIRSTEGQARSHLPPRRTCKNVDLSKKQNTKSKQNKQMNKTKQNETKQNKQTDIIKVN